MYKLSKIIYLWALLLIPYEYIFEYLTGNIILFFRPYRIFIILSTFLILITKKNRILYLLSKLNNIYGLSYLAYITVPILISSGMQFFRILEFEVFINNFILIIISGLFFFQFIYFAITSNFTKFLGDNYRFLFYGFISSTILGLLFNTNILETEKGSSLFRFPGLMNSAGHYGFIAGIFFITPFVFNFKSKNSQLNNIIFIGLPGLIAVINSGSRATLIATFFTLIITQILKISKNKSTSLSAIIVGIFIVFLFLDFQNLISLITNEKVSNRFSSERIFNIAQGGRLSMYFVAWNAFLDNPITGVGLGNLVPKGDNYLDSFTLSLLNENLRGYQLGAHNEFLRTIAEGGILSGALLIIFVGSSINFLLKGMFSNFKEMSNLSQYILALFTYNIIFSISQDQIAFVPFHLINASVISYICIAKTNSKKLI